MTIIIAIIVFGILIIVHEFGHFIIAKFKGCRVLVFSIGFGPKLIKKRFGETEFSLSLVPFGGYVKLFGESEEDREKEDSFFMKPYITKVLVIIGGALFNFIFAWCLYTLFYTFIGTKSIKTNLIASPHDNSPAQKAGIKEGYRIISYNGEKFESWEKFLAYTQKGEKLKIWVKRQKDTLLFEINPYFDEKKGIYETGLYPLVPPVAGEIIKNSPAFKAGIMEGDTFLSINGEKIVKWNDMVSIVETLPNKKIVLEVKRGNKIINIEAIPEAHKIEDKEVGKLGIYPPFTVEKHSFFKSMLLALLKIWEIIYKTFLVIGGLFVRKYPLSSLGGPILIGKMIGESARMGLDALISFVAFISTELAIINLLPIPALDGGQLTVFTIEKVIRKRLSKTVQMVIQAIGFGIIIAIAIFVTFLDIKRIFIK